MRIIPKLKKSVTVTAVLSLILSFGAAAQTPEQDFRLGKNMEILINLFREINLFYVDDTDPDRLLQSAANGMTRRLDPYTEFIPEEEVRNFEILTTGKYGGIGSLIKEKGDYVYIDQPYMGFPADRAGLKGGDKILSINGEDARNMTNEDVSSRLKGDPGTTVNITVEKFFSGQVEELTITRERIVISGVPYYGFINDSIGYIQHLDFTEDCHNDLRAAFMEMKNTGNLRGLIIDYRGNGGGILQEAVKIMSFFVPKGMEIVSMRGRLDEMSADFYTETEPIDTQIPIVLLTNKSSASASEIVAGAFQDLDRAVILGQRTHGKGLVQTPRHVGYNSYLKITTAKYYTPSGRCIQEVDYTPLLDDGRITTVPDSLIREYSTTNGRKVYDGGGIMPDIRTEPDYISRFTIIAYGLGYIDEFVDHYMRKYPDAVDVDNFRLSDSHYQEFVTFMEDKDMEFESDTQRALEELKKSAGRELYGDILNEYIEEIEKRLKDDKATNLALYKDQLSEIIEDNIIVRHHYSQGVTRHKLLTDNDVIAASELLGDTARYEDILRAKDTDKK